MRESFDETPLDLPEDLATRVLEIARSKMGQKEEGGPNHGPIVEWSMKFWTDHPRAAWCAGFVCTCFLEAGSTQIQKLGSGSVPKLWQRCEQAGCTWSAIEDASPNEPQPGDIVFFAKLAHVGLVEKVEGERLYTIEGNHHDRVAQGAYPLNSLRLYGFARIT